MEMQILAGLDAIGKAPSVPIHGDLKPLHLILDGERVVLLDLDKFAAGEPMLDVTNMLVLLRREQKSDASLARAFTEEYFAHVPAVWERRFAPHFAWAMLTEASAFARGLGKSPAEARPSRPEKRDRNVNILVNEARAILAGQA
jgi:aminoglycoside phosphotransferase (APT) family kinase protein